MTDTSRQDQITQEAVERALARLRPPIPLDTEEIGDLKEMLSSWRYKKQQREEWRRRIPWIFAAIASFISVATFIMSIVQNYFQTGGGHK